MASAPTPSTTPSCTCAEANDYLLLSPPSARYAGGEWSSIFELEENYGKCGIRTENLIHYIYEGENGQYKRLFALLMGENCYSTLNYPKLCSGIDGC